MPAIVSGTEGRVIDEWIRPAVLRARRLGPRLAQYLHPFDARWEDITRGPWHLNVIRDLTAGLVVAMVAIPLAMGFAMASGLRPEQGIVGGAIAGLIGALWGGSKYQVYGPTAAFIPLIGSIMATHGYGFLVLASMLSGVVLMLLGLGGLGRLASRVPHAIVVGFTLGIAVIIALAQGGELFGISATLGYSPVAKVAGLWAHRDQINLHAVALALGTFLLTRYLLKVSVYLPAPLLSIGLATVVATTVWSDRGLVRVRDRYGAIPTDFWTFTPPAPVAASAPVLLDLAYYTLAIVVVAAIESVLCSRMADRLADNRGTPFNPSRELWGQGLVNIVIPLLNGFPHTGALARTATNIRLGAVSPLAGVAKCVLKLALAAWLATWLEGVPMACIGGILLYVASGMVKWTEIDEVLRSGRTQTALMAYTAIAVVLTDFLTGVLTALALWALARRVGLAHGNEAPPAA